MTPDQRAINIIKSAENAKARILPTTGKPFSHTHSAFIDETYIVVGNHVDINTVEKIKKGDYLDFGKLIPRDRILAEEDQRLEMVIRGNKTYYVPVNETTSITSYAKWEQAFRVFANIYTKENPHRSSELIEYNHVIHTIAMSYT